MATEIEQTETRNGKIPNGMGSNSGQQNGESEDAMSVEEPIVKLGKYILLLATVTYAAGFKPPGGVWQETDPVARHLAGDPIIRDTHYRRYLVFFYCNATAFASSLVVIVLLLLLAVLYENKKVPNNALLPLRVVMVLDLVSLMGVYVAGACRDTRSTVYYALLVVGAFIYLTIQMVALASCRLPVNKAGGVLEERLRKMLMLLATFAVSVTYVAGMSTPGGFWDNADDGHQPGDPILKDHHDARLRAFFAFNTMAFIASLIIVVLLLDKKLREKTGSPAAEKARSLVLLLATLAAAVSYQAGLDPPGGLWQDNGNGHTAGDPILLTTNPRRYKAFFYCNSIAFVASLVAIVLVRERFLLKHHVLEAAMILDLFGLIGAYAAGSSRDVSTSIYAMALAGAVLVYVVIHEAIFTLDHKDSDKEEDGDAKLVENRRKRLLLFAVLVATITYQAGLTPPGGFRLQDEAAGHHAGDPVLFYNYPRRYKAFFYCNSVSFMLSIALIILLVNPILYKPAIRSNALSVCTAVGLFSLMGAYAAGSTQHLKTSIYIFLLGAVVLILVIILLIVFLRAAKERQNEPSTKHAGNKEKELHAKRKYLMLLGILVASVTYQAGLKPPGGAWQRSSDEHEAGNPIMHDNRRHRYLAFFYTNSTSFVASIVVILLLLPKSLHRNRWWFKVMNMTIVLDLLCLLGAYAAGSNRGWKTSIYVIAVLAYIQIHLMLLSFIRKIQGAQENGGRPQSEGERNGVHQVESSSVIPVEYAVQFCSCNVRGAACNQ